jgi:hypothetical protein
MNLQEFVTKTLSQISTGVATAKNDDERIAPKIELGGDNAKILRTSHGADSTFLVEFDVAVTTGKGPADEITVLPVPSAKGEAKRTVENSYVSRIRFSVPVSYWRSARRLYGRQVMFQSAPSHPNCSIMPLRRQKSELSLFDLAHVFVRFDDLACCIVSANLKK